MTPIKLLNSKRTQIVTISLVAACLLSLIHAIPAGAAPVLVKSASNAVSGAASISTTLGTAAITNNLVVVICGSNANSLITAPNGFSTAAIQLSGSVSQAIYYKVSTGNETSVSCNWSVSSNLTIQIYEFSGIALPLDTIFSGTNTGTGTLYSAGSVTPTYANAFLIASYTLNTGSYTPTWLNSFANLGEVGITKGKASLQIYSGAASFSTTITGTYTTSANGSSGTWRGHIVSFRYTVPELIVNIVNSSGVPVVSPSVALTTLSSNFTCQPATGTLGTSTQRIRVTNTTATPGWSLGVAATNGGSAVWSNGSSTYAYNSPAGLGCTSGQLSAAVASGTLAPVGGGCTNTGISLGANSAFNNGVVNSITLASASNLASTNCSWDITNIPLTQQVPAEQDPGTYSLPLTLTLVAN